MRNVSEIDLHCPSCGYILRGLPEPRCPECGEIFDPREVVDEALGRVPDGFPNGQTGTQIWWRAIAAPGAFARAFPRLHDSFCAWQYSLVCYVIAAILCAGAAAALGGFASFLVVLIAIPGAVIGFCLCETLCAAELAVLAPAQGIRRRDHFWRGLMHYTSGYTVFTALWGVAASYGFPRHEIMPPGYHAIVFAAALLIVIWWAAALVVMVQARVGRTVESFLPCLLVPAIGIGCIALGYLLSFWIARHLWA